GDAHRRNAQQCNNETTHWSPPQLRYDVMHAVTIAVWHGLDTARAIAFVCRLLSMARSKEK
ncbi:MAG: hypothetical protein WCA36_15460, partial [Pseudolabrys sp.]